MEDVKARCCKTFKHYVEVTSVGLTLTEADKKEIKDKGMNKMLKECCGDAAAKASESSIFPKYCDKRTKKLKLDVFLGDFLTELAAAIIQNQKKLTKRPDLSDPDVVKLSYELRTQIADKSEVQKKESKLDAVTARLTDTKGYTGTHKNRFSPDGTGKGIAGRRDIVDDSGYVTGFKTTSGQEGAGSGKSG